MSSGSRGGSLVHRAANRLQSGPVHTLDLARHVLGLSGHPGAAAEAVFTLLGRDARFVVDGDGTWSLLDQSRMPGSALNEVAFAVVDVETTGGSLAQGHRIIDVAVVEVCDGAVVDEWRTLVNPGCAVAPLVEALTGIRTDMLQAAPYFEHIAPELQRRLEGRVFVAHNSAFDWRFVSSELNQALGEAPEVARLCTVKMARALLPSLRRRNLDAVSTHFGVRIQERHRAYGDALATARVLIRLLDEAGAQGIVDLEALVDRLRPRRRRPRGTSEARAARRQARREARRDAAQGDLLSEPSPSLLAFPPNDPAGLGPR